MKWQQTGLTLIVVVAGVIFAIGVGVYSFLKSATIRVHGRAEDVPSAATGRPPEEWAAAVEHGRSLVRAAVVHQNLPGISIAVGVRGKLVWTEGFGWADIEKRTPITPGTRFRVGHASKPLTSAAVGLLLEKRALHLNDEIQTYVPAYPKKAWPVTLHQLMGHMAGLRHYDREEDYMPTAHCERAADGVPRFADDPLRFEPDTRHSYSTFGWILVSAAVESAAGEPFFAFMRSRVFQPLGMADTTADAGTAPMPNRATFYYPRFSGDPTFGPAPAAPVDYSCFAGAGAFLSTPSDMVRFGLAMVNGTLLQSATVTRLQTPQQLASGAETGYGLGWTVETIEVNGEPTRLHGHSSRTLLGASAWIMTFPDLDVVVGLTSNISFADLKLTGLKVAEAFTPRSSAAREDDKGRN